MVGCVRIVIKPRQQDEQDPKVRGRSRGGGEKQTNNKQSIWSALRDWACIHERYLNSKPKRESNSVREGGRGGEPLRRRPGEQVLLISGGS